MRELSPDKWMDLLTDPNLSEAEVEQYRTLFENDAMFQAYVKMMHYQGVLDNFRQVMLAFFEQGYEAEVGIIANAYLWLYTTQRLFPELDDTIIATWMKQSMFLSQILFQFAVEALYTASQADPSLVSTEYPQEWEDMYTQWRQRLYSLTRYQQVVDPDALLAKSERMTQTLKNLWEQYEQISDLKLDLRDYHKIFTHLLLQTFIFAFLDAPQVYYELALGFDDVYLSLGFDIPPLLIFLKGKEHLLLPENQEQLMAALTRETEQMSELGHLIEKAPHN